MAKVLLHIGLSALGLGLGLTYGFLGVPISFGVACIVVAFLFLIEEARRG